GCDARRGGARRGSRSAPGRDRRSERGAMEGRINGVRLSWREAGRGEPVLLLHPFPFQGGIWEAQLERLAGRMRLLAPDMRGFGGSERGAGDGPLTMDQHADDMAALLDHLGIEAATVCGVSMGGYVAFALSRRHRQRVPGLVPCATRAAAGPAAGRAGRAAPA